jgi:hypothetical protein
MAFLIMQESRGGFCISGGPELTRQVPEEQDSNND